MIRNILSFIAALAAATTIVAAQTPPPSSAQPPAQPGTQTPTTGGTQGVESNDLKSDSTAVLTGCVAAWQGNAAGVTNSEPSSSSTAGARQFMLSNAQPSSAAASASSSAMGSGYLLKGGSDVDLSQHLNHKVEVTGTLDTAGRASGTYPTTQPAGQTSGPTMQTFRVTSVKMISTSCQ